MKVDALKVGPDDHTMEQNRLIENSQKDNMDGTNVSMIELGQMSPSHEISENKKSASRAKLMQMGRQGMNTDAQIKNSIKKMIDGTTVTIVMSLVTLFALVGDTLRQWLTNKEADQYFDSLLIVSMLLFSMEILLATIVVEDFKYSYFFWLDIVATFSLIFDINLILDAIYVYIFSSTPSWESVNARPDLELSAGNSDKIKKLLKSLRLIRLIRILKLYKYMIKSNAPQEEENIPKKRKKKNFQKVQEEKKKKEDVSAEEMSLFMTETDPNKLGKSLSETLNR